MCYWILHFILFASVWLLIWCLDHLYPIWFLICALKKKKNFSHLFPLCLSTFSFFLLWLYFHPPALLFFFYLLDVTLLLLVSGVALGSMVCMSSLPQSTFKQYYATLCAVYDYCKQIFSFPSESHSVMADSLPPHELYSPWNSPGQNTGVGSHSLLQGIFPTQGLNPGLPHCKGILYQLSHQGSWWSIYWGSIWIVQLNILASLSQEYLIAVFIYSCFSFPRASLIAQLVKNLPAIQETLV